MRYRIAQFLFILPLILFSTTGYSKPDVWKLWKQPGVHAIMRHTTAPGFGDPENFTLGKCDTQRNLNEVGRQEARALGPKEKVLYVTHQVNTTALTGVFPASGQIVLFKLGKNGEIEVLGEINAD